MNDNQPLEPQKIPSRLDTIENEIGSKDKWYKKIWNHPWLKKFIRISDIFIRYSYQCFLIMSVNNQHIDTDNPKLLIRIKTHASI